MKKVLVTGASGFIGKHCIPSLLSRGFEVHALSQRDVKQLDKDVVWHKTNILDPEAACELVKKTRCSHLLHLAWYAEPGQFWDSPFNLDWVQASLHLLKAFSQSGGKRAVMAGTCAEYDWDYGLCSESQTPLNPRTLYGVCKSSLEKMARAYCDLQGVNLAWGRVFYTYGPQEHPKRFVASIINSLIRGNRTPCSHGRQIRDFLYIQDVADLFAAILDSQLRGAINIGSGKPIRIEEIITKIAQKIGREDLIGWGQIETLASEPPMILASTARLVHELKAQPKISLDVGIDRTIQWWEKNGSANYASNTNFQ
jgi:nucleoside-diphosphate-sugar epimerase